MIIGNEVSPNHELTEDPFLSLKALSVLKDFNISK